MPKPTIHLICNAHLDPVWQWPWEEGAAEAVSTFRTAADFCDEFDAYIFNHNEAVLYQWIEEYEPALFKRIQKLVKQKRWHIMCGWYLQPDCNLPSGEGFVRQILAGREYFKDKFNVQPNTAINFDPFGHTRGLVQIMAKSGYDSYIYCRPPADKCAIPADNYHWLGFDGSTVINCRARNMYNSGDGQAREKVQQLLPTFADRNCAYILWGIGNHGGGPSRKDLHDLTKLIRDKSDDFDIIHSTPEAYFKQIKRDAAAGRIELPTVDYDLNPIMVGCYTSMARIKQAYRRIESELFATEMIAANAAAQNLIDYPTQELADAQRDMLFAQFHDILPGSGIEIVEDQSVRGMHHGLEKLARVRARAFFSLAAGQKKVTDGQLPILVYNPYPYPITTTIDCEVQPADSGWDRPQLYRHVEIRDEKGNLIPSQVEKEGSSIACDWRKKPVFCATLPPGQMSRFNGTLVELKEKPKPKLKAKNNAIRFKNDDGLALTINTRTGLVDQFKINGTNYLDKQAFRPIVIHDDEDPWGMRVDSFRKQAGVFSLLSAEKAAELSGLADIPNLDLPAVRVIEDGPVRSVVEVLMAYNNSTLVQQYKLPKHGTEIQIDLRVFWNEKNRMLKLSVPATKKLSKDAQLHGQVAYGNQPLPSNGNEAVAQKWTAIVNEKHDTAITCINDGTYGYDFADGEMRISLLRAAAYCAHPVGMRQILPHDRFLPRIDQGQRTWSFWINAGKRTPRLNLVDREADQHNAPPFALSFCPPGQGKKPKTAPTLDDDVVQLTTFKKAEKGAAYILRLFNPTPYPRKTTLKAPSLRLRARKIELGKFEIKTFKINSTGKLTETDLVEKPL